MNGVRKVERKGLKPLPQNGAVVSTDTQNKKYDEISHLQRLNRILKEQNNSLRNEKEEHKATIVKAQRHIKDLERRLNQEIEKKEYEFKAADIILQLKQQLHITSQELEVATRSLRSGKCNDLSQFKENVEEFNEIEDEIEKQMVEKEDGWQEGPTQLKGDEKSYRKGFVEKENEFLTTVSVKNNVEDNISQLKEQMVVITEVDCPYLEAEKDDGLSYDNAQLKNKVLDLSRSLDELQERYENIEEESKVLRAQLSELQGVLEAEKWGFDRVTAHYDKVIVNQVVELEKLRDENGELMKAIHELNMCLEEMQETHDELVQENERQKELLESQHAEFIKKNDELREKGLKLMKDKEEKQKFIESILSDQASLRKYIVYLSKVLNETTQRYSEISEKVYEMLKEQENFEMLSSMVL